MSEASFAALLEQRTHPWLSLTSRQIAQLENHYNLLVRWNKVMNLTAIRSVEDAVLKHYAESLFLAAQLKRFPNLPADASIADIGSGPGFPGFPIAVVHWDFSVTLIESHQKKAVFLQEAARDTANVAVVALRAETVTRSFDLLSSRAVAWRDISPLIPRVSGRFALLASATDAEAILTETRLSWFESIRLPWAQHSVVLLGSVVSTG